MAQQDLNYGSADNDGTGEGLRDTFIKIQENFDEIYGRTGLASYADSGYTSGSPFAVSANTDTILPNRADTIYDDQLPIDVKCFYFAVELDVSVVSGTLVEGETVTGGTSGATAVIVEKISNNLRLTNYTGTFSTSETITGGTSGATATITTIGNGAITGRDGDGLDIMIYFKAVPSAIDQWVDIWIDIEGAVGELYTQTFPFPKGASVERGVLYGLPSAYTRNTFEGNNGDIYIRSNNTLDIYDINFNFDRSHKAR